MRYHGDDEDWGAILATFFVGLLIAATIAFLTHMIRWVVGVFHRHGSQPVLKLAVWGWLGSLGLALLLAATPGGKDAAGVIAILGSLGFFVALVVVDVVLTPHERHDAASLEDVLQPWYVEHHPTSNGVHADSRAGANGHDAAASPWWEHERR